MHVFFFIFFSREEICLLLTRPPTEDGDYIPNFRPGKKCTSLEPFNFLANVLPCEFKGPADTLNTFRKL